MSPAAQAEKIEKLAKELGCETDLHRASTGTYYLTVEYVSESEMRRDVEIKIRFADHGECYCNEDLDVSPTGCDPKQAREYLLRRLGFSETKLRRLRRMRRSTAERDLVRRRKAYFASGEYEADVKWRLERNRPAPTGPTAGEYLSGMKVFTPAQVAKIDEKYGVAAPQPTSNL